MNKKHFAMKHSSQTFLDDDPGLEIPKLVSSAGDFKHQRKTTGKGYPLWLIRYLSKLGLRTRVVLAWLCIILCACVIGSAMRIFRNSTVMSASPSDIRHVTTFSSTFCESITLKSVSIFTTYKVNSSPQMKKELVDFHRKEILYLNRNQYHYWGFYLLKGSTVTVHVCSIVHFYQIKGKENLNRWITEFNKNNTSPDHTVTSLCRRGWGERTTINITVEESDYYYFLFLNTGYFDNQAENAEIHLHFRRKVYSFYNDDAAAVCERTSECSVSLSAETAGSVAFYADFHMRTYDFDVNITCKPRVFSYIKFFSIPTIGLGTLITLLILKCQKQWKGETTFKSM